jgi:hypothetical protein
MAEPGFADLSQLAAALVDVLLPAFRCAGAQRPAGPRGGLWARPRAGGPASSLLEPGGARPLG